MDTTLLPAAIKGDKIALSTAARAKIAGLNGSCPQAFTFQLAWTWTVIIGAIVWAEYVNAPWATVIAIFLVATRQNLLGILVHEQADLLGYRGRFGDLVVNCFAAYPLLVLTVEGYAQVHLSHHRDYFNATDPDFQRKSGDEWSIPMRPIDLAKLFLMDLLGINTLKLIRGKQPIAENMAFARRHRVPRWLRPAYFVSVAALLTLSGTWMLFLVYWLLPIVTITQVMVRWGALCEHKYNLLGASVVDSTPLIILSWWERLLLPNLNFAMHPYHHFFPGVSFSRLPTLHAIFLRAGRPCRATAGLSWLPGLFAVYHSPIKHAMMGNPLGLGRLCRSGFTTVRSLGDGNGVCDVRVLRSKLGNALRRDHGRDQFPKRGRNGAPPQMGSQIPLNQVF